jgi:U3 small nucleolar RNA-associated protein 15
VKVYSVHTYAVTHGLKYSAPVLSLAISPDNTQLVVGTSDGELTTRMREVKARSLVKPKASLPPERVPGGTAKFFERGKNVKAPAEASAATAGLGEDASGAAHQRKQRLRPFDAALRKYRYHEALDAALASRNPTVVVTVLEELVYRAGLEKALAGRDEATLEPLLSFLARYTTNPRFAPLLVDVGSVVFETYKAVLGQSEAIDELFTKLGRQVKLELGFQQDLMGLLGAMDAVMSAPAAAGEAL